jgi:hypothetical protein
MSLLSSLLFSCNHSRDSINRPSLFDASRLDEGDDHFDSNEKVIEKEVVKQINRKTSILCK